jgi:hypothetical protein
MERERDGTGFFLSLAGRCLREYPMTGIICAFAGRSVGRGKKVGETRIYW